MALCSLGGTLASSRFNAQSQMPPAAAIPPRGMVIARRTATPAFARHVQDKFLFYGFKDRASFLLFLSRLSFVISLLWAPPVSSRVTHGELEKTGGDYSTGK